MGKPVRAESKVAEVISTGKTCERERCSRNRSFARENELGLEILPESEADRRRAKLVDFGDAASDKTGSTALSKPLFAQKVAATSTKKEAKLSKRRREEEKARQRTVDLAAEISGNTRAALDPFLVDRNVLSLPKASGLLIAGIKRKRVEDYAAPAAPANTGSLVDYTSE